MNETGIKKQANTQQLEEVKPYSETLFSYLKGELNADNNTNAVGTADASLSQVNYNRWFT